MRILLASASPRRRELLAAAGLEFTVGPVPVDENLDEFSDPARAAVELATRKALAAAGARAARGEAWAVLGADTIVALERDGRTQLLGKPHDEREAAQMLARLSGTRHEVVTGVCVVRTSDLARWSAFERTVVSMRPITPAEREAYVASGEWRDKAGGYAIQESADRFVEGLEGGGFDNVVGLPVALAKALLARAGAALAP
ncbi:MAG: septum formation protein Maf [Planctomycetes bacterium]|nr:septum formation protein Maf [Planctomycetota bacterium]